MSIRLKILSGFLILVITLFVAGIWSIHELNTVGTSVQRVLDDEYTSLHAARMMIEALEKENSGTQLMLLGNREQGRAVITSADSLFEEGFQIARTKRILPKEKEHLDLIRSYYDSYRTMREKLIIGTGKESDLERYFNKLHGAFSDLQSSVVDLLALNDQLMYRTATDLRNRSDRAIMPGIIAITAALVFTLIFNFFINYYVVSPLVRIGNALKLFMERRVPFDVEIESDDEISDLASAIGTLCIMVQNPGREV